MKLDYRWAFVVILGGIVGAGLKWTSLSGEGSEQKNLLRGDQAFQSPVARESEALPTLHELEKAVEDVSEPRALVIVYNALDGCPDSYLEKLVRRYARRNKSDVDFSSILWESLMRLLNSRSPQVAARVALDFPDEYFPQEVYARAFEGFARADLDGAIARLKALPSDYRRRSAVSGIVRVLWEQDESRALEFIANEKQVDIDHFVRSLKTPAALRRVAAEFATNSSLKQFQSSFARAWGNIDLKAAIEWTAQSVKTSRDGVLVDLIRQLSESDLAKSLDYLEFSRNRHRRSALFSELLPRLAEKDPAAAMEKIAAIRDPMIQWRAMTKLAESVQDDPDRASIFANGLPAGSLLRKHFEESLMPKEEVTLESLAGRRPKGVTNNHVRSLLDSIVESSRFEEGAAWIAELPGSPESVYGVGQFARGWAGESPEAVAEWAMALEIEGYRKVAIEGLVETWTEKDAKATAAFVSGIEDDAMGRQIKAKFTERWARSEPLEAIEWAAQLPFNEQDSRVLDRAFYTAATVQPADVAAVFTDIYAEGSGLESAANVAAGIAEQWSNVDAAAAVKWAQSLAGDVRLQAEMQAYGGWAQIDAHEASQAVALLPEQNRDGAAAGLAMGVADADPDAAWAWGMSVQDSEIRADALRSVVYTWKLAAPDAARAAIESATIPEATKQSLLNQLR